MTILSRLSQGPQGQSLLDASDFPEISADGTAILLQTAAGNAFLGGGGGITGIWRVTPADGAWARVSIAADGALPDGHSFGAAPSGDGRFIAFTSLATNLHGADRNPFADVFLRDMDTGALLPVSVTPEGATGNSVSFGAALSADGRFVAFLSAASDLVALDTNNAVDVFLRDMQEGWTQRVSTGPGGAEGNGGALNRPSVSADGRFVVFDSLASNLVEGDTNQRDDVFVKDMATGLLRRVSVAADGTQQNGGFQGTLRPQISADGRYVVFASSASNLVPGDSNGQIDVFRKDLLTGAVQLVSVAPSGQQGNAASFDPRISADGRFVAFTSRASNFAPDDLPLSSDIFLRDMVTGSLTLLSATPAGRPGFGQSVNAAISADGSLIVFASTAPDLVAGDHNALQDIFLAVVDPQQRPARGTPGPDRLEGTPADDTLEGLDGDDLLIGRGGRDWLHGGPGSDTLEGGAAGAAIMLGGPGDDHYVVLNLADRVIEQEDEGTDTAWVLVDGWTLPAHVEIGRLADQAQRLSAGAEGAGVQLVANPGLATTLIGGAGDDVLWGGPQGDRLEGGAGHDTLRGGPGADTMLGEAGDDHVVIDHLSDVVIELPEEGTDTAWVTVNGWVLPAEVEIGRLAGDATRLSAGPAAAQLVANPLRASTLLGGVGNDVLWGGDLGDRLEGGVGHDTLRGGLGADTMLGGPGHDHYIINHLEDMVIELPGQGYDTAWITVNGWVLPAHLEVAYLSGDAFRLTGSWGGENLVANPTRGSALDGAGGNDTLWGSDFADTLRGGPGDDVLYGFGGADVFVFDTPKWGRDMISDFRPEEGDRLDLRGAGVAGFAALEVVSGGGHTLIRHAGQEVFLFDLPQLLPEHILF